MYLPIDIKAVIQEFLTLNERSKIKQTSKENDREFVVFDFKNKQYKLSESDIWYRTFYNDDTSFIPEMKCHHNKNVLVKHNFYDKTPYAGHIPHYNGYCIILQEGETCYVFSIETKRNKNNEKNVYKLLENKNKKIRIIYG